MHRAANGVWNLSLPCPGIPAESRERRCSSIPGSSRAGLRFSAHCRLLPRGGHDWVQAVLGHTASPRSLKAISPEDPVILWHSALEVRLRARVSHIPRKRVRTKDVVISEMIWVCDSVGRTWNHYKFQKLKERSGWKHCFPRGRADPRLCSQLGVLGIRGAKAHTRAQKTDFQR